MPVSFHRVPLRRVRALGDFISDLVACVAKPIELEGWSAVVELRLTHGGFEFVDDSAEQITVDGAWRHYGHLSDSAHHVVLRHHRVPSFSGIFQDGYRQGAYASRILGLAHRRRRGQLEAGTLRWRVHTAIDGGHRNRLLIQSVRFVEQVRVAEQGGVVDVDPRLAAYLRQEESLCLLRGGVETGDQMQQRPSLGGKIAELVGDGRPDTSDPLRPE